PDLAARVEGTRYLREGGRFLGDHHRVRKRGVDVLVNLAEELDGFNVLLAAVAVRNPLAFAPPVIQIQHRRHGIYAQAVHVILIEPEQGVASEKTLDFTPSIVEDERTPVGVLALPGVGMLVKMGAVEVAESGFVL